MTQKQEPRERPILFSAPMVRAILAGKKTQTRRIIKNEFGACDKCFTCNIQCVPHNEGDGGLGIFGTDPYLRVAACPHNDRAGGRTRCRYGAIGDRLWVKETFSPGPSVYPFDPFIYRADTDPRHGDDPATADHVDSKPGPHPDCYACERERRGFRWRPSIHMPRRASRITLEIVGVRIERLHAITESDAIAEGLHRWKAPDDHPAPYYYGIQHSDVWEPDPCLTFKRLWTDINGAESWDANPWVWVIEFKRA